MARNQRLLISVYDPQEAREAILGGARVIDCEDPAGALGDISPRNVMMIGDAVIGYKQDLSLQISTNIGENQLLFKRDDSGRAVQRFPGEIAGKAAQAGLGVAAAMGTDIHPVNIVKVGLDGMPKDIALETLREVTLTLDRSNLFSRSQVVAVFFAQDLDAWQKRRSNQAVIRDLLLLREYVVDPKGDVDIEQMFGNDLTVMAALKEKLGDDRAIFDATGRLVAGVKVRTTQLYSRASLGFDDDPFKYLLEVADLTKAGGADGVMIDTRIHSKVSGMCCLKEGTDGAAPDPSSGLPLQGIYSVAQFADYARYCHQQGPNAEDGIEFWASGSIQPYQAPLLWALKDGAAVGLVDAMAVRSGATAPVRPWMVDTATPGQPPPSGSAIVNRASKRVYRDLVAAYAPPSR